MRSALAPATIDGRDGLTLARAGLDRRRGAAARARAAGDPRRRAAARRRTSPTAACCRASTRRGSTRRTAIAERGSRRSSARARAAARRSPRRRRARAAVAAAPFRESARVALIEVLQARGNVAEAVRAYEELRTLLREELGTVPGPGARRAARAAARTARPPPPPRPPRGLLERDDELDEVGAALARLAAGEGGVVVFEGPAGIGKTRLLTELRKRALATAPACSTRARACSSATTASASRASCFPASRRRADCSAAAPRAVRRRRGGAHDSSFAVLDGAFHAHRRARGARPARALRRRPAVERPRVAALRRLPRAARRGPADPRRGDRAHRRARRRRALLGEISHDPAIARAARAADRGRRPTRSCARASADADGAFAAACHEVTAGNPLLVRQLLTALEAERVAPDAAHAEEVRAVGPRAVSRTVLLRLARLPDETVAVARAVAILGEHPALPAVAALAASTSRRPRRRCRCSPAPRSCARTRRSGFVHPLVRDAVYGELPRPAAGWSMRARRVCSPTSARARSRRRAAAARAAARRCVGRRAAARGRGVAIARGAPDAAMAHLERAQAEPPAARAAAPRDELGVGGVRARAGGGRAAAPGVRRAHRSRRAGAGGSEARRMLMFVAPARGASSPRARWPSCPPSSTTCARACSRSASSACSSASSTRPSSPCSRRPPRPARQGPGAGTLTAMAALTLAVRCGPAREAAALAREAFDDDAMLHFDPGIHGGGEQVLALAEPAEGERAARRMAPSRGPQPRARDRRRRPLGRRDAIWRGDLAARSSVERAYEGEACGARRSARTWATRRRSSRWHGSRSAIASAPGRPERIDGRRAPPTARASGWPARPSCCSPTVRRGGGARGRRAPAPMRPPDTHPVWAPWRSPRARALAAWATEAVALAEEDLALAGRTGAVGRRARAADPRRARGAAPATCARRRAARRDLGAP